MEHMWLQFKKLKLRQNGQLELPFISDDKRHTIEPIEKTTLYGFNKSLKTALDYKSNENKKSPNIN